MISLPLLTSRIFSRQLTFIAMNQFHIDATLNQKRKTDGWLKCMLPLLFCSEHQLEKSLGQEIKTHFFWTTFADPAGNVNVTSRLRCFVCDGSSVDTVLKISLCARGGGRGYLHNQASTHDTVHSGPRLVIENAKGKKCPADTINEFELYDNP